MAERWGRDRVLDLAPDAAAQRAGGSLASRGAWSGTGWDPGCPPGGAVWGQCRGSAAQPYQTVVDLAGPAYKCSCPSRKFPCKHALGLLLRWSDGAVGFGLAPDWAAGWLSQRARRSGAAPGRPAGAEPADPVAARRRAEQREARVATGLDELDRWLRDQVRQGLAETQRLGYRHWDSMAARLVDAQAPGAASLVRGLAGVPRSGEGWAGRLLAEYAQLHLLTVAARRQGELDGPLRASLRSRIGFTTRQAEVAAAPDADLVTDLWEVLGLRDTEQDQLRTRRVWLRGVASGRFALVLSFAVAGQTLDDSLTPGTSVHGTLAFYPAAVPLRVVVHQRTEEAGPGRVPPGGTVADLLAGWADALAADPWLDSWPVVLTDVVPARPGGGWALADAAGDSIPVHPAAGDGWVLAGLSGGQPVTVAGEWTPLGLWPLTGWGDGGPAVRL